MPEIKMPIVFKSEASLWDMMAQLNPDGRSVKPFDMRRWDLADDRIYRLQSGTSGSRSYKQGLGYYGPTPVWTPDEKQVSFVNKVTGELLTFEYLGVMFERWAPGWGFLLLGKRLSPPVEEM